MLNWTTTVNLWNRGQRLKNLKDSPNQAESGVRQTDAVPSRCSFLPESLHLRHLPYHKLATDRCVFTPRNAEAQDFCQSPTASFSCTLTPFSWPVTLTTTVNLASLLGWHECVCVHREARCLLRLWETLIDTGREVVNSRTLRTSGEKEAGYVN